MGSTLTPGYAFTRDGVGKPIGREKINILSTRRAARDFNPTVHHDVTFWASILSEDAGGSERLLAERCVFEHEVRRFLARAQERGYTYPQRFPGMPGSWVDFVNQNKAAENEIARLNVRRAYENGRREAAEVAKEGWTGPAVPAIAQPFDPIAMIDRLIQDAVAQRLPLLPALQVGPISPAPEPAVSAHTGEVAETSSSRMSDLLAEFLKPLDRKRKHTAKGRGEAAPVVQFAIRILRRKSRRSNRR